MRKTIATLTGALALLSAGPAVANIGATLQFVHPSFTLRQARALVIREQHREGFPLQHLQCSWASIHRAECSGLWTGTVLINGTPETLRLTDWVTRSGPCATHVITRTGHYSGIAHGGGGTHPHNCFTGPLVAVPASTSLTS